MSSTSFLPKIGFMIVLEISYWNVKFKISISNIGKLNITTIHTLVYLVIALFNLYFNYYFPKSS